MASASMSLAGRCDLWMAARTVNGLVGSEVGDSLAGSTPAPSACSQTWRHAGLWRINGRRPAGRAAHAHLCMDREELPGFTVDSLAANSRAGRPDGKGSREQSSRWQCAQQLHR